MKTLISRSALALLLVSAVAIGADSEIIRDVEGLLNSLPAKDPSRQSLTLRLADLYFDKAAKLGGIPGATDTEQRQLADARKKAVRLYEETKNGNAYMPKVAGDVAWKVKFQLARLYADLSQNDKANPLWNELIAQEQLPKLRQEAALRLAEYFDAKNQVAEADRNYILAHSLCAGGDICSYIMYRRAWLFRNQGRMSDAIDAMKSALYDSKGQVREESLRDLLVFIGAAGGDGTATLPYVEELATRLQRPNLLKDLSDAYFAAGNRPAGAHVLNYVNAKSPTLDAQIRLMEEFYGARNWEKFRTLLDQVATQPAPASPEEKDKLNRQNIMKRLLVQLDGERATRKDVTPDFQAAIDLYLALFPEAPETYKMVEGWLAAETSLEKKLARLKAWETSPTLKLTDAERKKMGETTTATAIALHRERAATAQKGNDYDGIIAEVTTLLTLEKDGKTRRELEYQRARATYSLNKPTEALPLFQALAKPVAGAAPDKWAVQSQHLALSILGSQKRYGDVVAQVQSWTQDPAVLKAAKGDSALAKDLAEMEKVGKEASFQQAAALGQSAEGLTQFLNYCEKGEFLPQSCENAKVLAVQLKHQDALIRVLRKTNAQVELAAEYEAAGHFTEAGKLLETLDLAKPAGAKAFLKVALMYELGGQLLDRNRILGQMTAYLAKNPKGMSTEEEPLVLLTLKDAALITESTYKLAWSEENRIKVAAALEDQGKSTAATQKDLLASKVSLGKAWDAAVLKKLTELDEKQRKVSFYGANSQARFERRLRELKALTDAAEHYYPGAPTELRAKISTLLGKAHDDLAATILSTPIPKELSGEAVEEVNKALATMAEPFQEKGKEYAALATPAPAPETPAVASTPAEVTRGGALAGAPKVDVKASLTALHQNPTDRAALEGVKSYYEQAGNERLAAYFKGRLLQLDQKEGT